METGEPAHITLHAHGGSGKKERKIKKRGEIEYNAYRE